MPLDANAGDGGRVAGVRVVLTRLLAVSWVALSSPEMPGHLHLVGVWHGLGQCCTEFVSGIGTGRCLRCCRRAPASIKLECLTGTMGHAPRNSKGLALLPPWPSTCTLQPASAARGQRLVLTAALCFPPLLSFARVDGRVAVSAATHQMHACEVRPTPCGGPPP
jgi:hypothetical protein